MEDWEGLFRAHILERGLDYYESGAVEKVVRTKIGYRARVEGTEEYEVEIRIKDGEIQEMYCDCPYAGDGNYCKHMAAVLYQIEEEEEEEGEGEHRLPRTGEDGNEDITTELRAVIDGIPEEELKRFLEKLALEDNGLKNRIMTNYSNAIGPRQMDRLKNEINSIVYRYSDRSGFVDYRNAHGFISELEAFLYNYVQTAIDKGCYMEAFELTNQVFVTIGNQDMDDSDGGTSMAAETCYEFWQQILEKCGEQDKKKMSAWFKAHQSDGTVIDYMEDYIREFLINELQDREFLLEKMRMLDQLIESAGESTDCGTCYSPQYGFEDNILKRLQIMKKLGCSEEEIRQYRLKYRRFASVRKLEIGECLKAGRTGDAIRILKESKILDCQSPVSVKAYSRQLIDLYSSMHMKKEYKEELLFQVFSCMQDDLEIAAKLKSVCVKEEWEQYRERLLTGPTGGGVRLKLLEAEGLYGRLLEEVIGSGSVYALNQYEKTLKKKFPDRLMSAYIAYTEKGAETAADRTRYKELMVYLKKIASYPRGREEAQRLAGEWKTLYKRRTAMMDELKKAGF